MNWCFATINNKLAEIYFEKKYKKVHYLGHCFVSEDEYKTREEKSWIKKDTSRIKLIYRNGSYKEVIL